MYTVKYSVLKYKTDMYLNEEINVAVAFHLLSDSDAYEKKEVQLMSRMNRLFTFNDELNKKFTKIYLKSIKDDWEKSLNNIFSNYDKFEDYTGRYVNNFQFKSVITKIFQNKKEAENFMSATWKHFLHYSNNQEDRMTKEKRNKYVKTMLENEFNNYVEEHKKIKSVYGDIIADFKINLPDNQIWIKYLNNSSDVKDLRSYLFLAKKVGEKIYFVTKEKDNPTLNKIIDLVDKDTAELIKETNIDEFIANLSQGSY